MNNSIIDEVRSARAELAAEHGYDRAKVIEWARARQAALKTKSPNKASHPTADTPSVQLSREASILSK